jgi:hypothetical protein
LTDSGVAYLIMRALAALQHVCPSDCEVLTDSVVGHLLEAAGIVQDMLEAEERVPSSLFSIQAKGWQEEDAC